jgi:hypothetical protein
MRIRFFYFTLLLASAILVVAFWLRPVKQSSKQTPLPQETIQPATNIPAVVGNATQNVSRQPSLVSALSVDPKVETDEEKTERLVREANAPYETSIMFYGRMIDQDSNSLPGVKINVSIYYEHLFMPTASGDYPITNNLIHPQRETDMDGRFEITGEKGRNVTIESIQKDGFEFESGLPKTFGAVGGSFENPVVFKMWSTNIHEHLIGGDKSFDIVPDGRPYFINLTDDTISESGEGDLKIWIQYTNQPVRGQLYDWSAEIDVINGGLSEQPLGSAMYEAPAEGYVPSFVWKNQIKGGQRGQIGDHQFYLLLKNGREYGQMSINLHAPFNNQTPGLIRLSYAINPSGSRILR